MGGSNGGLLMEPALLLLRTQHPEAARAVGCRSWASTTCSASSSRPTRLQRDEFGTVTEGARVKALFRVLAVPRREGCGGVSVRAHAHGARTIRAWIRTTRASSPPAWQEAVGNQQEQRPRAAPHQPTERGTASARRSRRRSRRTADIYGFCCTSWARSCPDRRGAARGCPPGDAKAQQRAPTG